MEKQKASCCWQIFTVNAAGARVHRAEIQANHADENREAVIAKLRELVMFDLSPAHRSEAEQLPKGGRRLEVQELDLGYLAGRDPVYRAKFICGI